MNLDDLKQINASHGYPAGDIVLQGAADILLRNLRTVDSIGRTSDEEFCFCLPGTDIKNSQNACERYRLLIETLSFPINSQELNITASFGLTSFIPDQDDASSLMMRANTALYLSKKSGCSRIETIYPRGNSQKMPH
jgi:diguanylate cyclase (GGDEF)-like protein